MKEVDKMSKVVLVSGASCELEASTFLENKINQIIVEVGSTCTKIDQYDGLNLKKIKEITIEFKKHYHEDKKLRESDINLLIENINALKSITPNIYVCGTSIFRKLQPEAQENFLNYFKQETDLDFNIISQEKENELTVKGATKSVLKKVCVFVGGGGSTEISIYDNQIIESVNSQIGVIDVTQKFPDLAEDKATTSLEEVINYIKENINLPKNKADILILAGGAHKYFAENSKINYEKNTLYQDKNQPIMMDVKTRIKDTKEYYESTSLEEIKSKAEDPNWWYATRAMCAFVLVIAEAIEAKYIIPTDIAMAYGLLNELE